MVTQLTCVTNAKPLSDATMAISLFDVTMIMPLACVATAADITTELTLDGAESVNHFNQLVWQN